MAPLTEETHALRSWQEETAGFTERLAAFSYCPSSTPQSQSQTPTDLSLCGATADSMSVPYSAVESNLTSATPRSMPGLTDASSTGWGSSSIASRSDFQNVYGLEGQEGEALRVPRQNPVYPCFFLVLGCTRQLEDTEQWKTHVTSHFEGCPPPGRVTCLVCPGVFQDTRPRAAWESMLDHIIHEHFQEDHPPEAVSAGMEILRHLFNHRVISLEEFKLLQVRNPAAGPGLYHDGSRMPGPASGTPQAEPVFMNAGRRHEQRNYTYRYHRG